MPEPILVAISAALAGKAVQSFYDFVKNKIAGRREAVAALEAAKDKAPESPEVQALAAELEKAGAEDPQFAAELRDRWQSVQPVQIADRGGVNNYLPGNTSGITIQAGYIGGISGINENR